MTGSGKELVPVKRRMGAPKGSGSVYTEEIADEIIERISAGETLTWVVKYDETGNERVKGTFPSYSAIGDWADPKASNHRPDFVTRFARARLTQQRYWVESTVDIARNVQIGIEEIIEHSEKNGISRRQARKDMLGHRNLQIETIHKAVARINPALWAERLQAAPTPEQDPNGQANTLTIIGGLPDDNTPPPPPPYMEEGSGNDP